MSTTTKENPQAVIQQMRDLAQKPSKKAEMQAAWNKVCDQLEPFYLAMRPKPKSFEVHHMNETARLEFARALIAGQSMDDCVAAAVSRIKGT